MDRGQLMCWLKNCTFTLFWGLISHHLFERNRGYKILVILPSISTKYAYSVGRQYSCYWSLISRLWEKTQKGRFSTIIMLVEKLVCNQVPQGNGSSIFQLPYQLAWSDKSWFSLSIRKLRNQDCARLKMTKHCKKLQWWWARIRYISCTISNEFSLQHSKESVREAISWIEAPNVFHCHVIVNFSKLMTPCPTISQYERLARYIGLYILKWSPIRWTSSCIHLELGPTPSRLTIEYPAKRGHILQE